MKIGNMYSTFPEHQEKDICLWANIVSTHISDSKGESTGKTMIHCVMKVMKPV